VARRVQSVPPDMVRLLTIHAALVALMSAAEAEPLQSRAIEAWVREARQHPSDRRAQLRAGEALTQAVLNGDRVQFPAAVDLLERAYRLDPSSPHVMRKLGRLLNLPLSVGDLHYTDLQLELYRELVEVRDGTSSEPSVARQRFVDHCFLEATSAAAAYREGHPVRAVLQLRDLEQTIADQLQREDDLDLHAMLGNYALEISGLVRPGRRRRLAIAVRHLEQVVSRYDELSPAAQGIEYDVPGVRVVFAYWLAEATLAAGQPDLARDRYRAVPDAAATSEQTPAVIRMAWAAEQRLARMPEGNGFDLLPTWPYGYDSCVACHSREVAPDLSGWPNPLGEDAIGGPRAVDTRTVGGGDRCVADVPLDAKSVRNCGQDSILGEPRGMRRIVRP